MSESLQTSARIPSTLTAQEGVRAWTIASSGCRIHPQSGQARLEGDELASQQGTVTEENAHLLQKPCFQGAIQSPVATAGRPEEPSGVTLTHSGPALCQMHRREYEVSQGGWGPTVSGCPEFLGTRHTAAC